MPLKYELKNGDIIEIITSPHHTPSKDWLKIVKSSRARNRIRAWIKTEERKHSIVLGKEICEKDFRKYSVNLQKIQKSGDFKRIAGEFGFAGDDDLLAAVGYGKITPGQIIGKLLPDEKIHERAERKESRQGAAAGKLKEKSSSEAVEISGVDDVLVRFGKCCNPLPGDPIIGFITRGRGVTVHTADCKFALENDPERCIDVTWNRVKASVLPVKIRVLCHDVKGILAGISLAIANSEANIVSALVQSTVDKRGENIFEVNVVDLAHLQKVMNAVMKVKGVITVERIKK